MVYIGIDPGQKGGIAYIDEENQTVKAYSYSNEMLLSVLSVFADEKPLCFVEKVGAMPGQGVTSMFSFGQSFGYILGALEAFKISYQLISPQKWKKHFALNKDKKQSIECCKRLFPNVLLLATPKCIKEHDGMAEALLIALYAKRTDKNYL